MNWIKLSDQKPPLHPNNFILVYAESDDPGYPYIDIAWYWGEDNDIKFTIGNDVGQPWNPTHWMPITPFPKPCEKRTDEFWTAGNPRKLVERRITHLCDEHYGYVKVEKYSK